LRGPYQAAVTENRDPDRLGRIRVALGEDPEHRSSHWIPWLTTSAGEGTGEFYLPEKGELVMVLAPGACPEDLVAVGALRGSKTRASAEWDSADNAIKVFAFRNGLELRVDDSHQRITLRTRGAALTLDGDGTLRLDGRELHGAFDGPVNLRTNGVLSLDGSRINLA
jgi:phage baseplate assembly protein gpV